MGLWDSIKDIGGKIVGGIGDAVSSIPKGIVSTGLNLAGNFLGDQLIGDPNSADAYKRQKAFYQNRYQWMMEDMQKAGLNPILAAGSAGFSTSGTPSVAQSTLPQMDYASSAKSYSEIEKINEEAKTERVRQLKTMAEVHSEIANKYQIRANTSKIGEEERQIWFMIEKAHAETMKYLKEGFKNDAEKDLLRANLKILNVQLQRLKNVNTIYSNPASMALSIIREIANSLGINIGVAVPIKGK